MTLYNVKVLRKLQRPIPKPTLHKNFKVPFLLSGVSRLLDYKDAARAGGAFDVAA